jgi:hypothetical protein
VVARLTQLGASITAILGLPGLGSGFFSADRDPSDVSQRFAAIWAFRPAIVVAPELELESGVPESADWAFVDLAGDGELSHRSRAL